MFKKKKINANIFCSPQVFRAELRLQELEEELLSCRVLQGLLQRETPLLYPLLTGLLTGRNGRRWREAVKNTHLKLLQGGRLEGV